MNTENVKLQEGEPLFLGQQVKLFPLCSQWRRLIDGWQCLHM